MENLAHYIIHTYFFPRENEIHSRRIHGQFTIQRMERGEGFDALEWLAAMCSHVSNKGQSRRA